MSALPSEFRNRLLATLLHCAPFDNDRVIASYFLASQIQRWQYRIPEANTAQERANTLIDFLWWQRSPAGENGLSLFLQVILDRIDEDDICHQDLDQLIQQLETYPCPTRQERWLHWWQHTIQYRPNVLLVSLSLATLLGIIVLLWLFIPRPDLTLPTPPNPQQIESITALRDWTIRAIAYTENAYLWLGAKPPNESEYGLYKFDWAERQLADSNPILTFNGTVFELAVDCQNNIWALVEGAIDGTVVYQPSTGETAYFNPETTDNVLQKYTMATVSPRLDCLGDQTELWLGRDNIIYSVNYQGAFPDPAGTTIIPNPVPEQNIETLIYEPAQEMLWLIDESGIIVPRLNPTDRPSHTLPSPLRDAVFDPIQQELWVLGALTLFNLQTEQQIDLPACCLDFPTLWVHDQQIWIGASCNEQTAECTSLLWLYETLPVTQLSVNESVTSTFDIVSTPSNESIGIWLATNKGLFHYQP